jgi:hypothetical protein
MDVCKDPLLVSGERYDKIETVREINDQISLIYQKMKGNIILDARDLIHARYLEVENDFATLLDVSIESKSYPEYKGILRVYQLVIVFSNLL